MKLCVFSTIWLKLMQSMAFLLRHELLLFFWWFQSCVFCQNVGVRACSTIPSSPLQLDILFYAKHLIDIHFFCKNLRGYYGEILGQILHFFKMISFCSSLINKLYFHAKIKWRAKINWLLINISFFFSKLPCYSQSKASSLLFNASSTLT